MIKPTDAQHDKRREWWIDPVSCDDEMDNVHDAFTLHPGQGPLHWQASLIHVREVLPGEIAITREQLEPLLQYFAEHGSLALETKLFGTLPEETHDADT